MTATTVERLEQEAARDTVEQARELLGLPYADIARALEVDRRTVYRYRELESSPSRRVRVSLENMREILYLLKELFEDTEHAREWLYSSVPMLNGRRAVDLLREGELEEVLSVLAGAYSGAFV